MGDTFGFNAAIGWGVEDPWGTAVSVDKFAEVISMDIKKTVERQESPSTRGLSERRRQEFLISVGGSFETEFVYTGMERLLRHLFGASTDAVVPSSVDGFRHTFTLADAMLPGLTIETNRGDSAASQTSKFAGCKITSATLSYSPNDPLKVTWNVVGKDETLVNETSVTYPDYTGIQLAKGHHMTCEFDDSVVAIDSFELTIENGLDVGKRVLGSQTIDEPVRSERRKVTGTLTLDWASTANYLKYINNTATKLEIICTGEDMGNDNSDPLALRMIMPTVRFDGESPAVSGPGIVKQVMPFYALSTGTGTSDSIHAELDNLIATAV